MSQGTNTVTCVVVEVLSTAFKKFKTRVQELLRFTALYSVFKFQTPNGNTGSAVTIWITTFKVQEKDVINFV